MAFSTGGALFIWALNPPAEVHKHQHRSHVTLFAWHPLGRFVVVGYANGEMQLLDSVSGTSRWLMPHQQHVYGLTFDPQGEILASSSWDSTRRYCDTATGRVLFEVTGSGGIQATADGRWFATFEDDGSIGARENLRSAVFRTFTSAATGYPELSGVDVSPDGRWLVSGDFAGLHLWDIAKGDEISFMPSAMATRPRFHPGGRFIVSGGKTQLLRWPFDPAAGRIGPPEPVFTTNGDRFLEVEFTPDGEWLAVPCDYGSRIFRWSDPAQQTVFGKGLKISGHDYVCLPPDRNWLAGASSGGDGVNIWNVRDGTLRKPLIENENARLAVSPDGATLATSTASELILWDTASWEPRRRIATSIAGGVPLPVVFSADGTLLAFAATRQEVHLLDPHTGEALATLRPPVPLNLVTLRFSPDSRHLAAQTLGPVVHLWALNALRGELRKLGLDW